MRLLVPLLIALFAAGVRAGAPEPPRAIDPSLSIELFAAEPDIVTPVGMTIDATGRLLVVESHTHFRPKDYRGPLADRIRIVEDTDGDGRADRFTTFWEGETALMNIASHPDGSIYAAARNEIFRLRDTDGDGIADAKHKLAWLETDGDYPHNGLMGLAIAADGNIWFSIGENLGAPYTLVGADGTRLVDDGSNAGMIFHCDPDGRGVTLHARGFWNTFGLCFDPLGRLLAVDNDPDGRPPCRLTHIVPGGDYGYQYRYGRSGQHPLNGWEGELPGSLPPITGTGEAPCQMLFMGGNLLVASWGDHRIESYTLTESGATFTATMQPIITGGEEFRPVGLASAPDRSLFISDWVLRDYQLHGKGRIWRVHGLKSEVAAKPQPSAAMARAAELRAMTDPAHRPALFEGLADSDPFIAQAAQYALSRRADLHTLDWDSLNHPSQRIGVLAAMRYSADGAFLDEALRDPHPGVRLMAVRWIADEKLTDFRAPIERAMNDPVLTPRLFAAYLAALERLDEKGLYIGKAGPSIAHYLLPKLHEPGVSSAVRVMAMRMLPADTKLLPLERARPLVDDPDPAVRLEAVRWLSALPDAGRLELLSGIAAEGRYSATVRAEAVVGLAADAQRFSDLLVHLAAGDDPLVSAEAARALRTAPPSSPVADRPPLQDSGTWLTRLSGAADAQAGRRIFFHPRGPGCYRCHRIDGRGAEIGPELTGIGARADRKAILESILQPAKEIAPRFATWNVTLADGRTFIGFLVGEDGGNHRYADAAGQVAEVAASQVIDRRALPISIMPEGLVQTMTDQELRDLLAYLTEPRPFPQ